METKFNTGRGSISLVALLGIWSVSALTSLPGLAVSPIMGDLSRIFPQATELDIQMLTSLPSLLIIPFILLAGHFTERVGYVRLLYWGLGIFLLSGVLYFLCRSMGQLIWVSALLGVGAGIIIPLSTALVSRFFTGEYRTRQFGYSSAITNVTLVLATTLTGYLAEVQWRLPFVVYLFPAVSLLLVRFIVKADGTRSERPEAGVQAPSVGSRINYGLLVKYMLYYLLITYLTVIVSFNLPFLMDEYGYNSGESGVIISLFFLAIMLPGFFLNPILKYLRDRVEGVCLMLIGVGLLVVYLYHSVVLIGLGCIIMGLAYGVAQPYVYDRTSQSASPSRVSFALALVMTMNYVAILLCPFIIDWFKGALGVHSERFAFGFNVLVALGALFIMLILGVRKNYR